MEFKSIFEKNEKWIQEKLKIDKDYFKKLSQGQSPEILYIGCSDSRIPAEEMMGAVPGEVFVHRNVANQVITTDANLNAVVQYAVEALKVKHIVICGHYECGGVKAALNPSDMGQINSWLQKLRDVYRLHAEELNLIKDETKKFDRLVELNVLEQAINVLKLDHVQKVWAKGGHPKIHGWVFDIRSGKIIDLKLDMEAEFDKIRNIYDLGQS
ncbi:MAG: carbonic anhydrase [Bacteriovoracaceae bacterium]